MEPLDTFVIVVLSAAYLLYLVSVAGILVFSVVVARMIDQVHRGHLDDMRRHLNRMVDQVLAISDANMDEIRDRRVHEAEMKRSEAEEARNLIRGASGASESSAADEGRPHADLEYNFGEDDET